MNHRLLFASYRNCYLEYHQTSFKWINNKSSEIRKVCILCLWNIWIKGNFSRIFQPMITEKCLWYLRNKLIREGWLGRNMKRYLKEFLRILREIVFNFAILSLLHNWMMVVGEYFLLRLLKSFVKFATHCTGNNEILLPRFFHKYFVNLMKKIYVAVIFPHCVSTQCGNYGNLLPHFWQKIREINVFYKKKYF